MSLAQETIGTRRIKVPLVLVVAALLVVAVGGFIAMRLITGQGTSLSLDMAKGSSANLSSGAVAPPALDVVAKEVTEYILVYAQPAPDPRLDRAISARSIDAQTRSTVKEVDLGAFTGVELAPNNSPAFDTTPHLVLQDRTGHGYVLQFGANEVTAAAEFRAGSLPRVTSGRDIAFAQEGMRVVARDSTGLIVASYSVPRPIPPEPGEPTMDGKTIKIMVDPGKAHVSNVVPTADGDVLAFVEGVTNSVLVNLVTGDRLDLPGYSSVHVATVAEDGYVYAVLWDRWSSAAELEVAKIDPATLSVIAQQPTGFKPAQDILNGRAFLAMPNGDVYVYLPLLSGESVLYKVDRATAGTTVVPLPRALGLDATVGVDGKIYFSGGPAENRVSVYDPLTEELDVDVPWLRAPEGTYVKAVVIR